MNDPFSERTEAFIRLLSEHERRLQMYALMLVPHVHDADEVLQEAKVVMWRNFGQFEIGTDFVAWAQKVIFYQVLKYRRQPARRVQPFGEGTLEVLAADIVTRDKYFEARRLTLLECMEQLGAEHRQILDLRYIEELSIEKISRRVNRTTGAVYRVLSRIRRVLLECISNSTGLEAES